MVTPPIMPPYHPGPFPSSPIHGVGFSSKDAGASPRRPSWWWYLGFDLAADLVSGPLACCDLSEGVVASLITDLLLVKTKGTEVFQNCSPWEPGTNWCVWGCV